MSQQPQQAAKPLTPPIASSPSMLTAEMNVDALKPDEIQRLLNIETLKKLQRENAEAIQKEEDLRSAFEAQRNHRLEITRSLEAERSRLMAEQSICAHTRKGVSLVGGLATWNNVPFYFCQSCGFIWEKCYPPAHLRPSDDLVGRPQVS